MSERTCIECGEPWPCDATVKRRKDGIPHRLATPAASGDVDAARRADIASDRTWASGYAAGRAAAIRAESAGTLDVERLIGALAAVDHRIAVEFPEEAVAMESHQAALGRRSYADAVAAEYARLAEDAE